MRHKDHMAKLGDAKVASRKIPKTEVIEVEFGREVFRYSCGILVSYENRAVELARREGDANVMVEVG